MDYSSSVSSVESDEPLIKYHRLSGSIPNIIQDNLLTALEVCDKLIALGTNKGILYILDYYGNEINQFNCNSDVITSLSIDKYEEHIAATTAEGRVFIYSLYEKNSFMVFDFKHTLSVIALDPEFSKTSSNSFIVGGVTGNLILSGKGWFSTQKEKIIHSNEGPIFALKWSNSFVVWANPLGVKIFDLATDQRIAFIEKPSLSIFPAEGSCHIAWKDESTLIVGWNSTVKIVALKVHRITRLIQCYRKGQEVLFWMLGRNRSHINDFRFPQKVVDILEVFDAGIMIAGITPYGGSIACLAYMGEDPPEIKIFENNGNEVSTDILSLNDYHINTADTYKLVPVAGEQLFYILSLKDLLIAKKRDLDDHISWLVDRQKYDEALLAAEMLPNPGMKRKQIVDIGQHYLSCLVAEGEFLLAATYCPMIFQKDAALWDKWAFVFAKESKLHMLSQVIPTENPQLSATLYEMILCYYLENQPIVLYKLIKEWPSNIYDSNVIIPAVEDKLGVSPDDILWMKILCLLYNLNGKYEKVIPLYLKLKNEAVFQLIIQHDLFCSVGQDCLLFMNYDRDSLMKLPAREHVSYGRRYLDKRYHWKTGQGVQLLVQNTDKVPIDQVMEQIRVDVECVFVYLDAIFSKDVNLAAQYHKQQVELYAEYEPEKLMEFLKTSHHYLHEKAYQICEQRKLVAEKVYLLGRIGNNKEALMLIINELEDESKAIEFVKEKNDIDLWNDLITYSLDKPKFIKAILCNVDIPIKKMELISRIPSGIQIQDLKEIIVKTLYDSKLQSLLSKDCQNLFIKETMLSINRLQEISRKGIIVSSPFKCNLCHSEITKGEDCIISSFKHWHKSCEINYPA